MNLSLKLKSCIEESKELAARRLLGSPVALSVKRTSKVYYFVALRFDGSLVAVNVYRTSKVYYLAARRLDGSPVTVMFIERVR